VTKFFLSFFLCLFFLHGAFAQTGKDSSLITRDSGKIKQPAVFKKDTTQQIINKPESLSVQKTDSNGYERDSLPLKKETSSTPSALFIFSDALKHNDWFNFSGKGEVQTIEYHKPNSDEGLFYLLLGLVFYFSLVKVFFAKYLYNLVSLFFRASMRQQQIREQLIQTPLPSLLLNVLFVVTGGLYICFLVRYYEVAEDINFWLLLIDCSALIGALYLFKFFMLKMAGWIFNIIKATDTYIFIVFMITKILGILLLPLLVVLFFSTQFIRDIVVTISYCIIIFLFLYRFIASYPSVRNEIKVSIFQFFLYLCAFEIAPLLLIYKMLLTYLEKAS
jgi:hypothetical protein